MKKIILIMTLVVSLFTLGQTVTPEKVLAEYRSELSEKGINYEKYPVYKTVENFIRNDLREDYLNKVHEEKGHQNNTWVTKAFDGLDSTNFDITSENNIRFYPTAEILILHILMGYYPKHFLNWGVSGNIYDTPTIHTILTKMWDEEDSIFLTIVTMARPQYEESSGETIMNYQDDEDPTVIATEDSGWEYYGSSYKDESEADIYI